MPMPFPTAWSLIISATLSLLRKELVFLMATRLKNRWAAGVSFASATAYNGVVSINCSLHQAFEGVEICNLGQKGKFPVRRLFSRMI